MDFIPSAKGNPWKDLTEEWHNLIDNLKACSNCRVAKELQGGKKGGDRAGRKLLWLFQQDVMVAESRVVVVETQEIFWE